MIDDESIEFTEAGIGIMLDRLTAKINAEGGPHIVAEMNQKRMCVRFVESPKWDRICVGSAIFDDLSVGKNDDEIKARVEADLRAVLRELSSR